MNVQEARFVIVVTWELCWPLGCDMRDCQGICISVIFMCIVPANPHYANQSLNRNTNIIDLIWDHKC